METTTTWIAVLTGVLGAWLMGFSSVTGAPTLDAWHDLVVGGTVVTLAGYSHSRIRAEGRPSSRASRALVLLGVWLLLAPFALGVDGVLLWNDVVVGVLVTALAGYTASVAPFTDRPSTRHPSTDER